MNATKFETYNDWCVCRIGKCEIVTDGDASISHLKHGRVSKIGLKAVEYVNMRPKLLDAFNSWVCARAQAISDWRHNTPHFRFDCDGGSLAVRVNGNATIKVGCGGDGNHPVYIVESVPPFFHDTGVSLGACTIEPLDYDCEGGKPLGRYDVNGAWFYRHDGDVAIVIY